MLHGCRFLLASSGVAGPRRPIIVKQQRFRGKPGKPTLYTREPPAASTCRGPRLAGRPPARNGPAAQSLERRPRCILQAAPAYPPPLAPRSIAARCGGGRAPAHVCPVQGNGGGQEGKRPAATRDIIILPAAAAACAGEAPAQYCTGPLLAGSWRVARWPGATPGGAALLRLCSRPLEKVLRAYPRRSAPSHAPSLWARSAGARAGRGGRGGQLSREGASWQHGSLLRVGAGGGNSQSERGTGLAPVPA
eukprot:scaffold2284_cov402-Prasinococcus_capsulatus_cf.AAC.2